MTGSEKNSEVFEFPASIMQSSFLTIDELMENSVAYNVPLAFKIKGLLDFQLLKKVFDELFKRHEIFRTRYVKSATGIKQHIHADMQFKLAYESFVSSPTQVKQLVHDHISSKVQQAFNLAKGEVIRAGVVQQAEDEAILYVVFHHIAVDHFAVIHFMNELSAMYNELKEGKTISLAEPELQYADYVMWCEENQADLPPKTQAWKEYLEPYSGFLQLAEDKPRPSIPSGEGADYRFTFSNELSENVTSFCSRQNVSVYQVLMAALNVLLARSSSQKDIIVGTPFTTRNEQEELQDVVACFINMLPLATQLSESMSFSDVLSSIKKSLLFAYDNQDVPFSEIVNAADKPRDFSHNPLFQVGFVFQDSPAELMLNELECTPVDFHTGGAMYDLHFWMWKQQEQFLGQLTYSTDLYTEETISHLVSCYEKLLDSLLNNPEENVFLAPMLPLVDQILLEQINATDVDLQSQPLPDLITAQAKQQTNKIAVQFSNGQALTYQELDIRSNQLAHELVVQGVSEGDFVGLCIERNEYMLISLLAILKTGAAYIPLDPAYPEERLAYMAEVAGINLLLMSANVSQTLPDFSGQKLSIDEVWDKVSVHSEMFSSRATDDGLAYVIFTSGSTGKPKGVQVPHRAMSNFLLSMQTTPGFSSSNKLLAVTTLSFDIAVLELYLPLISGGSVVVATADEAADGIKLKQLIEEYDVDVMQATPSTWRSLLAAGFSGGKRLKAMCGGEAFPVDLGRTLVECCGEVWNMYGPTETTVWSTCYRLPNDFDMALIGQPIANTRCYVLDEQLQPTPIGVAGELYIGGTGVTCGYLGRDDLTQERFIKNPWAEGELYRTGDLVRVLRNGVLEYFNRIDSQVKVRGFRIELGEIESVLSNHEAIKHVVVEVKSYGVLDQRLVAYVQLKGGEYLTNTDVRRYLKDFLPNYMIPQMLVEMDEFPLTPNGKIDRKKLPDPLTEVAQDVGFTPPVTAAQKSVAAIWQKHLKIEAVGLNDNFFELGGHSILAVMVIHEIEQQLSVRFQPAQLVVNTLEQLVASQQIEVDSDTINPAEETNESTVNNDTQISDAGNKPNKKPSFIAKLFGQKKG